MRTKPEIQLVKVASALSAASVLVIGLALAEPASAQVIRAWEARYLTTNGGSHAFALALDSHSNVIVTGGSFGTNYYPDFATVKYDSNSNVLWVARYSGPTVGGSSVAQAIAVDNADNVYVTGSSWGGSNSYDYATVKYDAGGNQLWVARYDGPAHGVDESSAIAVDKDGNVYVNGFSWGTNQTYDYATIKYDANGKQLWAARYNGPGNGDDFSYRMALDKTGNVYVTGSSYGGTNTYDDIATVKYDPDGHQLWVARFDGPGHYYDGSFVNIAVDPQGNVIIAGDANMDSSDSYSQQYAYDYATIKYDPNGKQLWLAFYDGPYHDEDRPQAIAVDASGNVHVTGFSWGGDYSAYDFATVKYAPDGRQLWENRFDSSSDVYWDLGIFLNDYSQSDFPYAMALDSAGGVYITGASAYFFGFPGFSYSTVKYDVNGNQIWVDFPPRGGCFEFGDLNNIARAVAVSSTGDVYVTGNSGDCSFYGVPSSYTTIRYIQTNVPGLPFIISPPVSQTVLPHATVSFSFAAGGQPQLHHQWLVGGFDIYGETNTTLVLTNVYLYDSDNYSVVVWNDAGYVISAAARLTVLPVPDIYRQPVSQDVVVGANAFFEVGAYGYPLFYQWQLDGAAVPGATNFSLDLTNVQVSQAGDYNVVITNIYGAATSQVARLTVNADLYQVWTARYDGPDHGPDEVIAMKVDNAGNSYVTGYSYSSTGYDDYLTVKYGTNGVPLWTARYDGPAHNTDDAEAMTLDAAGNVYVTGASYGGNATGYDVATIKYGPSGNQLWAARYDAPAHGEDDGFALTVDATGNVYVTGISWSPTTGFDYNTIKYSSNGTRLWVSRYDGPAHGDDFADAIVVDSAGNVYVTGESYGGPGTTNDYVTIKYSPNGSQLWVARYDGPAHWTDIAYAVALDSNGDPYVTGRSYGGSTTASDFTTIKYNRTNGAPIWVARYNGPGSSTDFAYNLALDAADNVYVIGPSYGGATSFDFATVKYDSSGNQLWAARYTGPGSNTDAPLALAFDHTGNVYVTGYSLKGSSVDTADYATVKYDPNGNQLWAARYDGPAHGNDWAQAIGLDAAANVYVAGRSASLANGDDYVTVKYVQNDRPAVVITSPTNLSTILLPTYLLLTVDATDGDGYIAKVQFFNHSNKLGQATAPPFSFVWTNPPGGTAVLTARAWDDIGADTTSKPVVITLDHPPTALATVSPLVFLTPGDLNGEVVSANNVNAAVVLDASLSTDADGDPLQYSWFDFGAPAPFSTAIRLTRGLDLGPHDIVLHVADGIETSMDETLVEVITAAGAVRELIALVDASNLKGNKRPLLATLEAAAQSFDKGLFGTGENQLNAFQNKERAQLAKSDPNLAEMFIDDAQQILDALNAQDQLSLALASSSPPTRPVPQLSSSARIGPGGFTFRFRGEPGRTYTIQASPDLLNWVTLTNLVSASGTNEFIDPNSSNFTRRFYRAFP
jgi:uncharacterized delta-60 repeat protein